MKVLVIGQGYVGLPLAMRAAGMGYSVTGIDLDSSKIEALRRFNSFIEDVKSSELELHTVAGNYRATTNYSDISEFDVAVITVPTPLLDSFPDLSFIESAARALAPLVRDGNVIILESTTYPGTTDDYLIPLLEQGSGLRAGIDFHVGYSPERIDPGNAQYGFTDTPKIVSGVNAKSLEKVDQFYSKLVKETVPVSSTRVAELSKLLENTFRHVNIALINELAIFSHELGIDIWESIDAANTKPFGFMKFTPSAGVGGHCLPIDPSYLSWDVKRKLGRTFRFVDLANDINGLMPSYVVSRLQQLLNRFSKPLKGSKILLVGLTYKKNSSDIRESPSLKICDLLTELGALVYAIDPLISEKNWPKSARKFTHIDSVDVGIEFDCIAVLVDHDEIELLTLTKSTTPVLDTRNCLTGANVEKL